MHFLCPVFPDSGLQASSRVLTGELLAAVRQPTSAFLRKRQVQTTPCKPVKPLSSSQQMMSRRVYGGGQAASGGTFYTLRVAPS